jgi:hypothetical protein
MYFSQCQEDKFLHETYFPNKIGGTYIELGALDGVLYSNTKFFQDQLGWHGILIEPHPFAYQMLEKNHPQNYLFNDLVSSIPDEVKYRYFCQGHAAVSGVESTLTSMHFTPFRIENTQRQRYLSLIYAHELGDRSLQMRKGVRNFTITPLGKTCLRIQR